MLAWTESDYIPIWNNLIGQKCGLPGQDKLIEHCSASVSVKPASSPRNIPEGGSVQVLRVRLLTPLPHVTLHSIQFPHGPGSANVRSISLIKNDKNVTYILNDLLDLHTRENEST